MKFDEKRWRCLAENKPDELHSYIPQSSIIELFDEIYRLENALQDAQLKPKTVYTVTMYRYGNREWHSYVLGAFSSNDIAREWAAKEEEYRGGKYKAEIIRWGIDSPTDFLKMSLDFVGDSDHEHDDRIL